MYIVLSYIFFHHALVIKYLVYFFLVTITSKEIFLLGGFSFFPHYEEYYFSIVYRVTYFDFSIRKIDDER